MFFAHDFNDQRVHIDDTHSNESYYCPFCGASLITKKGELRRHHFAHSARHVCSDTWEKNQSYDNSDWHYDWQASFPKTNQEIKLSLGDTIHRADVLVGHNVIEFQHSILSERNFQDRNAFYLNLGYNVIWLFDVSDLCDNGVLTYKEQDDCLVFSWENPKRTFNSYDFNSGSIDLFFQISSDENSIVRVTSTSEHGFEGFTTTLPLSKEAFMTYAGVVNGDCPSPFMEDQEKNEAYLRFKEKYSIELNQQQERALLSVDGANLLLAVPGSGKTTVLVERLGYMTLVKRIPPERILAVTFGADAAAEMKKRFSATFGAELGSKIHFSTINSLANRIYKDYCKATNKPVRKLLSDKREERRILGNIFYFIRKERGSEADILNMSSAFSYIANMDLSMEEIQNYTFPLTDTEAMYKAYRECLDGSKMMDFNDQLRFAYYILTMKPEVLAQWRQRFSYICVDEAQDNSKIQHKIIRLLAEGNNLFMVGDEDQSIYGFRGAFPRALLNFRYDYKNPYILQMERNYRSVSQIVDLAQSFIARNKGRYEKHMVANRGAGPEVRILECSTREEQFHKLIQEVKANPEETAILYRDTETALAMVDLLLRDGVAFSLKSPEMNFFQINSVRDIVAHLALVDDSYNADALEKVCNKGILYLKTKQRDWAVRRVRESHITVFDALDEQRKYVEMQYRTRAVEFRSFIKSLSKLTTSEAIDSIMNKGYEYYMERNLLDKQKVEILQILAKQEPDIKAYLHRLTSLEAMMKDGFTSSAGITLSTIHTSKGKEFGSVYIADVYDGRFPSSSMNQYSKAKDNADGEQEERRLFYVGMTRAKNNLTIAAIADRPSSYIEELFPKAAAIWSDSDPDSTSSDDICAASMLQSYSAFHPIGPVRMNRLPPVSPTIDPSELDQQERIARDSFGHRWVRCKICKKSRTESEFIEYGGQNSINLGICRECNKRKLTNE